MKTVKKILIVIVLLMFMIPGAISQEILINELVSINTKFLDEFGNSSDWIELYNAGTTSIDLSGMKISDRSDPANAWEPGSINLDAGDYLLIYASGKDIKERINYQTIIDRRATWKYKIPVQNLGTNWRNIDFNDASWSSGITGFGYGDGDDDTYLSAGLKSLFIRKTFVINDLTDLEEMILHVDYDDAFIAYINNHEIARSNIGSPGQETSYNASTSSDHEAVIYSGGTPETFNIYDFISFLKEGENVICIQAYNISTQSSDFSIIPFLTIGTKGGGENSVPDILPLSENQLHTDFKLSSEGESVYLFNSDGSIADSVSFPEMLPDISFGRRTDGSDEWVIFNDPSPASKNGGSYYTGISTDTVEFSHNTGIYPNSISLQLSGNGDIRYTTDGSEPTESSILFNSPVSIIGNKLIKARIFKDDQISKVSTKNYLINISHVLPIVSLNTELKYLWDNNIGMYAYGFGYQNSFPFFGANFWEDLEYPFYFSYFDTNGEKLFESQAGAKIFGGWSRGFDQKSFSLFARSTYGMKSFEYPFFPRRPYGEFESLILRNSGNDWDRAFLRDAIMTGLMLDSEVDVQAYQPVVCYLNGAYWGMYNMREKINEHYLASLHGVNPDDIDLIELNGEAKIGSNLEYLELRDYITSHSLANNENYKYVTDRIDELNFIQYQLSNIYYDNTDWPGNNIRCWKTDQTKWRWIMYDTDFGLNLFNPNGQYNNTLSFATATNGPEWPNPPWSTLFLRKMMENNNFKVKFVNYLADAMNTRFLPEYASAYVESLADNIRNEIYAHKSRWDHNINWNNEINILKNFFSIRPGIVRNFIKTTFNLPATYNVYTQNDNVDGGSIQVNSLIIETPYWSGIYYQDNPITLSAHPKPGYNFDHWSGDVNSESQTITVNLNINKTIKAHFSKLESLEQPIVINEINYNSPEELNASDWIELHNFSEIEVDISGWILKDAADDHSFVLPENSIINAWGFMILCRNADNFSNINPFISKVIGDFDFGLGSEDDQVRLYNENGELMDSVHYRSTEPWPLDANGKGPTLELLSPELDNSLEGSWRAFPGFGTPGAVNHFVSDTNEIQNSIGFEIYPNPTSDKITVSYFEGNLKISELYIYDLTGKKQLSVKPDDISNLMSIDISILNIGQYLVFIVLDNGQIVSKLIEKH